MKSKYKNRAEELIKDSVYTEYQEVQILDKEDAITAMCKLAEEIEKESYRMGYYACLNDKKYESFTKEQAEQLLQKQRELCLFMAKRYGIDNLVEDSKLYI